MTKKKNKIPRKLKKQIKNAQIIYDLISVPKVFGVRIDERIRVMDMLFKHEGILFYDSSQGGNIPKIIGIKSKLKIVDKDETKRFKKEAR